jgi:excisionase family DNA binding protein
MKAMVEVERSEMVTKYYSMKEVAAMLGISRAHLYHLKDTRKLKVEKIGAQFAVSARELERIKQVRNGDGHAE